MEPLSQGIAQDISKEIGSYEVRKYGPSPKEA
jgi:hypothetical protein